MIKEIKIMKNAETTKYGQRMKKRYLKKINKAYRKYNDLLIDAEVQRKIFTLYVDSYEKLFDENVIENECFKDIRTED
jgi:hypothetical protein